MYHKLQFFMIFVTDIIYEKVFFLTSSFIKYFEFRASREKNDDNARKRVNGFMNTEQ